MISSILAFAAGIAAKLRPEPVPKPLDLARALIDARAELAEAKAEHDEAMRVLNLTREARDAARAQRDYANAQCRAIADRNRILERQRDALADQLSRLAATAPLNPSRFPPPVMSQSDSATLQAQDRGHGHGLGAPLLGAPALWPPSPFGPLLADPELLGRHAEATRRALDCTCVPGRADAFRNQQANVR